MAANPIVPIPSLTFDVQKSGDTVTARCHGKVVTDTTKILQDEVRGLIAQFNIIVLDLTDVSYMDSSGLGALVGLYVSAKRAGKQLRLVQPERPHHGAAAGKQTDQRIRGIRRIFVSDLSQGASKNQKPERQPPPALVLRRCPPGVILKRSTYPRLR